MIFPSFLFIVGVAVSLSFAARIERGASRSSLAWRLLRRCALLVLLGLAMNGFPGYDLHTLRLPGIFQRISICYLCAGLLYLLTSVGEEQATEKGRIPSITEEVEGPGQKPALKRLAFSRELKPPPPSEKTISVSGEGTRGAQWADWRTARPGLQSTAQRSAIFAALALVLLGAYWAMLRLAPVPGIGAGHLDSFGNLPAYVDRSLLGVRHMWTYGTTAGQGVTYDPEGILSTIPALANVLIGVLAGEWLRTGHSGWRKAGVLALAGLVLALAGWGLQPYLPLNKRIWTSTFALFSSGVSLLAFAALYALVDLRRWRWWTTPAMVFGTNAILAFVLSGVLTALSDEKLRVMHHGGAVLITVHHSAYQHLFAAWLAPVHASLAYAFAVVLLNLLLIYPLYRRRIFLRV